MIKTPIVSLFDFLFVTSLYGYDFSNLALILGAIFVTFLLISIANPPMIVNLEFFGITLGTYMFIFGPISAGIRVFIADRFRDRR